MIDYLGLTQQIEPAPTINESLINYLGLDLNSNNIPSLNPTSPNNYLNILNSIQRRQRVEPVTKYSEPRPRINYSGSNNNSGSALDQSLNMIRKHEGFRAGTYWDVNAHRLGYGSDTITNKDGSVRRVRKGDTVTREQAELDLRRRTQEFMDSASKTIGEKAFNNLPASAQASLTSLTYNYGSLNKLPSVVKAARSGDLVSLSKAIESLGSHNKGINRKRRQEEANYFLTNR